MLWIVFLLESFTGTCSAGIRTEVQGLGRTDLPRGKRQDSRADDDACRPSLLVFGLGWDRGRGGRPRAAVRPKGRLRAGWPDAAWRRALHHGQDATDKTARHDHFESRHLYTFRAYEHDERAAMIVPEPPEKGTRSGYGRIEIVSTNGRRVMVDRDVEEELGEGRTNKMSTTL
jgi:hypothetical protein